MASKSSQETESSQIRSGKDTKEYQLIIKNVSKVNSALTTTPDAAKKLHRKCQDKGWLSSESVTVDELVTFLFGRIRQDANQLREIVKMLKDIEGMDILVLSLSTSSTGASTHQPHYPILSNMRMQEQKGKEGGRYLPDEQNHGNTPPSSKISEYSTEDADDSGISTSASSLNRYSHLPSTPVNSPQQLPPTEPDQSTHNGSPSSSSEDEVFENDSERKTSLSMEESQVTKGEKELVMTDYYPASQETDVAERLRNLALDVEHTGAEREAFKKKNLILKKHNLDLQKKFKQKKDQIEKLEKDNERLGEKNRLKIESLEVKKSKDEQELQKLRLHTAELERKLVEKNEENDRLRESLNDTTVSAERITTLQLEVDELKKQLKEEKERTNQKETDIQNLKYQLLEKKFKIMEIENSYKDKVRTVERERDNIRVELEKLHRETVQKQLDEEQKMRKEEQKGRKEAEERNRMLEEELRKRSKSDSEGKGIPKNT